MSTNINSNFPSIHLIPSSIQGTAKQQQIQSLTNQVKGNEDKIAKIDKEIIAREKIIEAAETKKAVCVEAMQNCQNIMKVCEESKEIVKEMIGIYETLIARNNLQQTSVDVSNNNLPSKAQITFAGNVYEKNTIARNNLQQSKTKSPIVFKDINYNPPKIDFSQFDKKPLEPQESKKSYNQITKDYNQRNHSSSIFNDWFNSLRSHSLRFFKWF